MRTVTATAMNAVAVPVYGGDPLSSSEVVSFVFGTAALDANVKLKGSGISSPNNGHESSSDSVLATVCCLGMYMILVDIAEPYGLEIGYIFACESLGP